MNDKMPGSFIDTNVFIYAHDETNPQKTQKARELITRLSVTKTGRISTQVIQEFCNVMLKKSATHLKSQDVLLVVEQLLAPMLAHKPDEEFYLRTIDLHERYPLSFYDAMIVRAAIDLGCDKLYSEDLQADQKFGDLLVVNPFL